MIIYTRNTPSNVNWMNRKKNISNKKIQEQVEWEKEVKFLCYLFIMSYPYTQRTTSCVRTDLNCLDSLSKNFVVNILDLGIPTIQQTQKLWHIYKVKLCGTFLWPCVYSGHRYIQWITPITFLMLLSSKEIFFYFNIYWNVQVVPKW